MGKIPSYPEFVHAPGTWEPTQSFDGWLDAGIGTMKMRYGHFFKPFFEQGTAYGFTWRAPHDVRADAVLCGVLLPSRDSVGRHFPLVVMTAIPYAIIGTGQHLLPLALGDFFDRAYDAAAKSLHDGPARLATTVKSVSAPEAGDWALATAEYEQWCNATVLGEAWSGLYAESPLESALATIDSLARVVAPVRGVELPAFGPIVRLPLGRAGSGAASLWLDIIRRLCRWQRTIPTAFWSGSTLLVALGDAPPSALSDLWITSPAETLCDLTACRPVDLVGPAGSRSVAEFLNSLYSLVS
ncbi:MAG: type VI secretion system-associated protein TagF [Polyangiaceae bacterium]|nr:type VI secretion system-associated protein TagF [Polyangiaceae bacterium]